MEGEERKNTIEINENKFVNCWGFGKYGQIGKKFINYSLNPIQIFIDEKEEPFIISGGESHSAILTLTSKLYVFGKNTFGQLGLGNNNYVYYPILNQISLVEKVIKVSLGGDHTFILTEESALYSWGLNVFGQLGLNDFLARNTPTKLDQSNFLDYYLNKKNKRNSGNLEFITDIAAGAQHTLILSNINKIYACGHSGNYSLGFSSEVDLNIFKQVDTLPLNSKDIIEKISCGVYHSVCVTNTDKIIVFGKGEVINFEKPNVLTLSSLQSSIRNSKPSVNSIKDIKVGDDFIIVSTKDDELYFIGNNVNSLLGKNKPEQVNNFEKIELNFKLKQIDCGYNYIICLSSDNKLWGWGNNEFGQLCYLKENIIQKPTLLEQLNNLGVVKISCGAYHGIGLFNSGDKDSKNIAQKKNSTSSQIANQTPNNPNKDNNEDEGQIEIKKMIQKVFINSSIKNDFINNKEKFKIIDSLKTKISELELYLKSREDIIKELKIVEESLLKENNTNPLHPGINNKDSGNNQNKEINKIIPDTTIARGFDNNFEIPVEEIEFSSEDIGKGTFGEVKRGIWRKENVAVKFLKEDMHVQEDILKTFIEECNMLKNLRHPNILLFMGAGTKGPSYFIVTEFCDSGNLFELLHHYSNYELSWEERRRIALEIARGMNYLHSFQPPIVHRDLKSMNVLLDKNLQVKIADFGSSKFLDVSMSKQKGTFQWMAPEVIRTNTYTEKADVFSFGIILNEIAMRKPPYYGIDKKEVAKNVASKNDYRPAIKNCPKEFADLMIKCWDFYPSKRPTFSQIIDILNKMKLS